MTRILLALCCLFAFASLHAQERILSYDSQVDVNADGSLDVTERITVRAEGNAIRRGIYRDFPTRYKDRAGNRVVVGFQMIEVLRDGVTEPWFTERKRNGIRINTGNDDFLPTPAQFTYTLRYRTTRQVGFFDAHDELYWNAIGTGWDFPVETGSVEVRLPQAVPMDRMKAEGYTGAQGQQGQDYDARITEPGAARWLLTRPLAPNEGFTVVLGFPKGLVAEPSTMQRWMWLLKDNRGVLIALAGLVALLVFCVGRWHRVGRDPKPGIIITRYDPPTGYSPAGLRYMQRMRYDTRCFSSDLLSMAVAGGLRIHRENGILKDSWELEKTDAGLAGSAEQQALLDKLFPGKARTLELKNTNAANVSGAQLAHSNLLEKRFKPAFFKRNGGSLAIALLIVVASAAMAFLLGGGAGVPLILAIVLAMVAVLITFGFLVQAPTPEGRKLLDEIEGLKRYLSVAERDELKNLPGPDAPPALDAQRYEMLLPYAVALEVEDAWTRKFTLAAGAAAVAAATAGIAWYHGSNIGDLGSFSKAIGSSLTSQIASSSHAPGSSSGGGGGGSSGGGGGGGGGGGR
jgi:uncharacterized membrane protein YgcG